MDKVLERLDHVRGLLHKIWGHNVPSVGLILGSGLGDLADTLEDRDWANYSELFGFAQSHVEGHSGRLVVGTLGGVRVAALQGRVHLYEGYPVSEVVLPVRTLAYWGVNSLVITNAAGGIGSHLAEGDLMAISDHINLTACNPLLGKNNERLGIRFPDMSEAYDANLRAVAQEVAKELGYDLKEGVYAGLLGPSYETPAEINMLEHMGADAVGMSTVLEVIAARHMGCRVLGLSCISNLAAGRSSGQLSHDEVKEVAQRVKSTFTSLVTGVVTKIGNA